MDQVENVFNGTYENHVLPFLWQKGESQEIIKEYLEKISACDISEICIESRPHPQFCKDEWWRDLSFIIETCKTLGLKLWLLDDSHFPTGYANGLIKEKYPEHRKTVLLKRTFDFVGPQTNARIRIGNVFDTTESFYGALLLHNGKCIDISGFRCEDHITFDVPKGLCQVVLIVTSRKTAYLNDYINMVDKESCHVLIEAVYEPHYQHFKEEFGKTILGFFSDEPGFMNEKGNQADSLIGKAEMALPWSNELEKRLKSVLGDEYMISLPSLWMSVANAPKIRHDYMDIATTLYKECFDEQLGDWCRSHSVMHIGHVIEDKGAHARLGIGAGHFFRALGGQDMAGVDIVINQLLPGMDEGFHSYGRGKWDMEFFTYALAKLGSSAGCIDPLKKGRCMAEVFGAFGWHEGLKEMKWIIDHFLVRGVNYFVPHAFSQAPFPDDDCPPHFYAHGQNPQYRYFGSLMKYTNKMSTLLSGGIPHPTAAILYHAEAEWSGAFMSIEKVAKQLTRNQIDFTFLPVDVFSEKETYNTQLSKDALVVNGISYDCFILPYCEYIGKDIEAFFIDAEKIGFPIYIIDELPKYKYDADTMLADLSFANVVKLEDISNEMQANMHYDIKTSTYEPWLRYYHYTKEDSDIRMFVNEHPKQRIDTTIPNLKGTLVDLLNDEMFAFDGQLVLEPYQAYLLIPETLTDKKRSEGKSVEVQGTWSIAYASAKDYPMFSQEKKIEKLEDLSKYYPNTSGTFRYQMAITLTGEETGLFIDEAYESVEVMIDDVSIAHRICPPYQFSFPSIAKGIHTLTIDVTNTLDKEVVDMFSMSEGSEPSGILGSIYLKY